MEIGFMVEPINNTHSEVSGLCVVTGKPYSVTVDNAGLARYHNGAKVQHAFPNLSVDDREFLISQTSPEGWNQMFGGIEE